MEQLLNDMPKWKRAGCKFASHGLVPTIISAIGFAYIGIPEDLQITVRRWVPGLVREFMISFFPTSSWTIALLVVSVICVIWGGIGSNITSKIVLRYASELSNAHDLLKQETESKAINCYRLFSNWLYTYSNHLGLTKDERVSLYKLDMNMFSCVGRYSENEIFNSKPSRLYPREQGVISKVWELGRFEDADAPDPQEDMNAWVDYNVDRYGFTDSELSKIRMKSRSFYGIRLKNAQHATIAVVMFESLNPDGLPFGKISRLLNQQEQTNLTSLIVSLNEHIPTLESAREEGF